MEKKDFFTSNKFKIALPIILIASIITIFKSGYAVGKWIYTWLN